MSKIRVIKNSFNSVRKSIDGYSDDLAVMEFRSFHSVASLHVERVGSAAARDVIKDILEDLNTKLLQTHRTLG